MGAKMTKEDGLSTASIQRMYAARAIAAKRAYEHKFRMPSPKSDHPAPPQTDDKDPKDKEDSTVEADEKATSDSSSTSPNAPPRDRTPHKTQHISGKQNRTPITMKVALASYHLANAIRAFGRKASCAFDRAIEALRQIDIIDVAKAATKWMKEHPWETAAILVPLILLACTPAFLSIAGFTAGGIAAGSIAAGVHAGIGSVAAGSTFAILTSAAMGGYGVPIVFGGVWAISTAVMGGIAAWKRWRGGGSGGGSGGRLLIGGHNGGGGGGGGSDSDDDSIPVKNGNPSGGGGDCGETAAVYKHAAVKKELIKQDRGGFHETSM
ncbi:Ifi-6-16 multi-domain protein [Pyrenophora tritici-repentis]|nr:Ifi-6-16 multi-domain protein [Pyrenophora tritici-repentis]KAF7446591.1 Ifi-6-16 multi-domain protein [Pyrenophora tritici-repentis]KAG9382248.1 Ifi-6-16 multi-domain protein [Pyrenophora tritici-repentis]KAI0570096.1 Ifi-6-16 multi-domain protein [Pyrenophora tritici-repentis]KAI0604323.1 Ifi-6-16 multi-domain protein [Pyrenophora tritici-repentis]